MDKKELALIATLVMAGLGAGAYFIMTSKAKAKPSKAKITVINKSGKTAMVYFNNKVGVKVVPEGTAGYDCVEGATVSVSVSSNGGDVIIAESGTYGGYFTCPYQLHLVHGLPSTKSTSTKSTSSTQPPSTQQTPTAPAPTPTHKFIIDSDPEGIHVSTFDGKEGNTPLTIECEEGKAIGFTMPYKLSNGLEYSGVVGATSVGVSGNEVSFKTLCREGSALIKYSQPAPSTPKWRFDQGSNGKIYVYDAWYRESDGVIGLDIEVLCGNTGSDTDIVGASIIMKDSPNHGWLVGSLGCERKTITFKPNYSWEWDYGIEINARWRYGGLTPVIRITKSEVRHV